MNLQTFKKLPHPDLTFVLTALHFTMPCIIFMGLLFGKPFWLLLSDNHPLKLVLLLSFVIYIAWAMDRFFSSENLSPTREWLWCLFSLVITVIGLVILVYASLNLGEPKIGYQIGLWFLLAIIFVYGVMRVVGEDNPITRSSKPSANANPKPEHEVTDHQSDTGQIASRLITGDTTRRDIKDLRRLGQNIALAIMIMAMFFYAVEINPDGPPHFKWGEVAAILIIFLLAELGVMLVARSAAVKEQVAEATQIAKEVLEEAKRIKVQVNAVTQASQLVFQQAEETLTKAEGKADEAWKKLDKAAERLTNLAESNLWRDSGPKFYDTADIRAKDFWKYLEIFTMKWIPKDASNQNGNKLVGTLFKTFIGDDDSIINDDNGEDISKGTVRSTPDAISCVTVDTVYAEASAKWLSLMSDIGSDNNQKIVVWAISSLLPTDFAFPSIWWGNTGAEQSYGQVTRTEALNSFVGAVISGSGKSEAIAQYRRVTVLDLNKLRSDYIDNLQLNMKNTLDNWLVWDPRTFATEPTLSFDGYVESVSSRLARIILMKEDGNHESIDPRKLEMNWANLKDLYAPGLQRKDLNKDTLREIHVFPDLAIFAQYPIFNLFSHNFGSDEKPIKGGVIGASERILDNIKISAKELSDSGISLDLCQELQEEAAKDDLSLRQVYSAIGWRSVRQWYCEYMHRGTTDNSDDGAWWAILDNDEFLKPLELELDGYVTLPLDLLMIGTLHNPEVPVDIKWHGAAISNINSLRPECTVQLITNEGRLKKIEQVVKLLSKDFGRNENLSEKVNNVGKWINSIPSPGSASSSSAAKA